jgi:hypothetical protein
MAAVRHSPIAIRQWLVRLGHLCFDDFLLLDPRDLASSFILHPSSLADWSLALNNAPNLFLHFRRSINLQSAICNLQSDGARPCLSTSSIVSAQARLVTAFAFELLRAKAPPLYDALPWQDWDFSIVTKRFRLWQTRFLLAGEGTTVTTCRCRKSAGVYVLEPCETIARYIELKCAKEKVRRFRLLHSSLAPSLPLPSNSVDLAILGSLPDLQTANCKLVTQELLRVSANVLLIENSPLVPALDQSWLHGEGFISETVEVRSLGPRPCHWKLRSDGP